MYEHFKRSPLVLASQCSNVAAQLKYFPIVLKEPVQKQAQFIKVMCLQPQADEASKLYTVDPVFNGETGNRKKDYARIKFLFNAQPITGEVWREVLDGVAGGRAWRVVKRGDSGGA